MNETGFEYPRPQGDGKVRFSFEGTVEQLSAILRMCGSEAPYVGGPNTGVPAVPVQQPGWTPDVKPEQGGEGLKVMPSGLQAGTNWEPVGRTPQQEEGTSPPSEEGEGVSDG